MIRVCRLPGLRQHDSVQPGYSSLRSISYHSTGQEIFLSGAGLVLWHRGNTDPLTVQRDKVVVSHVKLLVLNICFCSRSLITHNESESA